MRNLVVFIFVIGSLDLIGQARVWSSFGDKALKEGDNYGASRFYLKAWEEDSTFNGLVYKLGIAFKGYHNNKKALLYFNKIENNKALQIKHPDYLFHLALLIYLCLFCARVNSGAHMYLIMSSPCSFCKCTNPKFNGIFLSDWLSSIFSPPNSISEF